MLAGTLGNSDNSLSPNTNNSITAAKLLNGVEKSYGGGRFFEDEDKVRLEEAISNRTLAGVHNISEDKLRKALKLGGLANRYRQGALGAKRLVQDGTVFGTCIDDGA